MFLVRLMYMYTPCSKLTNPVKAVLQEICKTCKILHKILQVLQACKICARFNARSCKSFRKNTCKTYIFLGGRFSLGIAILVCSMLSALAACDTLQTTPVQIPYVFILLCCLCMRFTCCVLIIVN